MAGGKSVDLGKLLKDQKFLCGMLIDPVKTTQDYGFELSRHQYLLIGQEAKKVLAQWSDTLKLIITT